MKSKNNLKLPSWDRLKFPFVAAYILVVGIGLFMLGSSAGLRAALAGFLLSLLLLVYLLDTLDDATNRRRLEATHRMHEAIVGGVKAGMQDRELMEKHGVSRKALKKAFKEILSQGNLKLAEVDPSVRHFRKSALIRREQGPGFESPKCRFPGISPYAFMHSIDACFTSLLRSFPATNFVLGKMAESNYESSLKERITSNCVRVTTEDFGYIHDMVIHCVKTLDLGTAPEVYLTDDPLPNACTAGTENPIMVLNVGLLALLDDDELHAVVAHEIGHIKCHHVLYRTVAAYLTYLPRLGLDLVAVLPFFSPFTLALLGWQRASELSADRAAVIVTGNKSATISAMRKTSETFESTIGEDESASGLEMETYSGQLATKFTGWLAEFDSTHPFLTRRVAEMDLWTDSRRYRAILSGEYPKISERQMKILRGEARDQFGELGLGTLLQAQMVDRTKYLVNKIQRSFENLYGFEVSVPQITVGDEVPNAEAEEMWKTAEDSASKGLPRLREQVLGRILSARDHLKKAGQAGGKRLRDLRNHSFRDLNIFSRIRGKSNSLDEK